ncbi:beta strand repeat-containing protein [Flavobacterium selenitireducens]|uniref:beta strand repeat-containing protein n=1 Tax=Flavobacterium selenitireducens TaxID=2722704 RepID=UPI00168BACDA|nr:hypothetical protein [Flavobacterium selenitireducens]MBD3581887.1 hypothetical protein [Flavobacterium selenitireducens]
MKNSRIKLTLLFFIFSTAGMAQVGVGTTAPAATLDVTATNLTGTTVDGLLIPRVSRLRAQTMAATPTSTMIYVNDISNGTATGTTINVTAAGFYFFNGTVWERLGSGATNAWTTTGNTGLSGTANFLGTTDNVDLAFRRANTAAGKIGATSTSFGLNALNNGAATTNTAFGTNALAVATGPDNVAFGNGALSANTGGAQNTAIGNGTLALNNASASTAVGFSALNRNTASNNTAVGYHALTNNTSGSGNTATGFRALASNATGTQNTAIGFEASLGTTGGNNTSIGYQALFFNGGGSNNTAIGRHALHNNTAGGNTAIGQQALLGNTTAANNTAVGSDALRISTGAANTAVGFMAGDEHGNGANNTYIGSESGRFNTGAATHNAFLGWQSGYRSSGSYNTAIGSNTLKGNGASTNNVAVGYNALTAGQTASNNTAIGYGTLAANTVGTGNVALGYNAGASETGSNKLYIDNSNSNASNALIYGEFDNNIARVNGTLQINNPANANGYSLPNVRGTNGQILQTNGAGATSWVTNPATSLSLVRANRSANQVLTNAGWQKVLFNTEAFDTSNEFNITNGRFTATTAGFYRIDAAFHTNNQSNGDMYSIGIYVNGTLRQETSYDHHGVGIVERSVSCLVQLAATDYVEVWVENFVTGVEIDGYSGKTVFEVQQVR